MTPHRKRLAAACGAVIATLVLTGAYTPTSEFIPTVINNTSLRALPGGVYPVVRRLGNATLGDGPPVDFYWKGSSSATDDGGIVIQPGAGSGRWVASPSPYDVRIWGADPTATADSTAAIQAATNACQATGGGIIWVPAGNFKIAGTVTNDGSYWCKYQGTGPGNASGSVGGSRLITSSPTENILNITANGGASVESMAFDSSVPRTAPIIPGSGYFLSAINTPNNNLIRDVSFSNYYYGLFLGWNNGTVDHALFFKPVATYGVGIKVSGNQGCDLLHDIQMYPPGAMVQPAYGVLADNSGCLQLSDSDIIQQGTDLGLVAADGQGIFSTKVSNTFLDTATNGFVASASGTGNIARVTFTNTWGSSHTMHSVLVTNNGTGVVSGFTFNAHEAINNTLPAFQFGGGSGVVGDVNVNGSLIAGGGDIGIFTAGTVNGFNATANRIGAYGGASGNVGQAIAISAGTTDCIITSDHMIGNASATQPVTDLSGQCQVALNTPKTANGELTASNFVADGGGLTKWSFDASPTAGQVTIANGSSAAMAQAGNGFWQITDVTTRNGALVEIIDSSVSIVSQDAGNLFVVSGSPSSGKVGISWNGTNYLVSNNQGASNIFSIASTRSGAAN